MGDQRSSNEAVFFSPSPSGVDASDLKHVERSSGYDDGEVTLPRVPRYGEELATALGEHAALITNAMDRWFDHALSQLEAISSRLDGAAAIGAVNAPTAASVVSEPTAPRPVLADLILAPKPLDGTPVARFRRHDDWVGWSYHQAAALRPGGIVEIRQDRSTPGIVSAPIAIDEGGLFRLVIDAEIALEDTRCRPHVRLIGDGDTPIGPDVPLAEGNSEIFMFAPYRTRELRLYLIVWQPEIGYSFKIKAVTVEKIDIEAYYEHRTRARTAPTIASLATIPNRSDMLGDCVASLLLQCDKVRVFLNGYPDVPPALAHPRVEIRRSQDWDDKGDAGKFGWLDCEQDEGYRIIVDDDLIFPVDFVDKMIAVVARHRNRAIAGVHGILLKQPVTEYYAPASRSVFFFQAPLMRERTVHVLGTNALCYHTSAVQMRWSDFMFRNMADIFLARYAQQHALAMVSVERPQHWVRQNTQEGGFETIYDHSLNQTRSRFDSSLVQDAMIKWMAPLTLQLSLRPKIVLAIIATSIADFEMTFESWYRTRWLDFDWVVMVTSAVEDNSLRACLAEWRTDHEMHVVDGQETTAFERIDRLLAGAVKIGFQMAVVVAGSVKFVKGGWTKPVSGLLANAAPRAVLAGGGTGSQVEVWSGSGTEVVVPALAIVNYALAAALGGLDPGLDDAHSAVYHWMTRAGAASCEPVISDAIANAVGGSLHIVPPLSDERRTDLRRRALSAATWTPRPIEPVGAPALTVNEAFERVLTINLDRRPDRWLQVRRRLGYHGIETERFRAVDGTSHDIFAEYEAYKLSPLVEVPRGVRKVGSSQEYYQDFDSQTARVAYAENSIGAKAIQSAGAWGYLKTWEAILEQALRDRPESLLVFDDDIILHRRTHHIFAAAMASLPGDWLILQLGTLQYHWENNWVTWRNPFLYSTNGSVVGSHAVGLKFEIIPFLLDQVKRMELPFDTGALAAATREFKERCFVAYPNIAIQSLADSDIGTSDFQEARTRADIAETYRWNLSDYPVDPGFHLIDKTEDSPAPIARITLNA